ncbi:related to permease of the major facilitator superfamily [Ramularia collo-cygni]|uniref:Related to permease of the major facilitator superfamily n=1 Tax=Ramularia collo-cygni TaxID=112498 RepID=A0A2D3VEV0_9PEZI|nr:related to permease of the major facilitator superfamily [Ramularia collo-cygni]CZT25765.1 related to permease of the major facilitator superfamily [Ramularia collo-cygni]
MEIKADDVKAGTDVKVAPASHGDVIDPAEERRLVRKLDMWLSPMMVLVFLVSYLDRSNIGNAAIAGMTEDLGLDGNKLNVAVTVFYVTYIAFEIPSSLILKKARPSRLIPAFIICWSAVVIGSAFMKNYATLLASRLLLGAFESGLFPCLTLYLSTYYKPIEQAQRVSYLFVASALSGAFGGLLAYGLTRLNGVLAGWRWLFLVEGLISMAVGFGCLVLLPDSFESAWWLTEEDKRLCRVRNEQVAIYQGDSETFDRGEVKQAFLDPKIWLSSICQFCANTCSFGFSTFLPVIIRGFGFSSVRTQLLTVPVYIWASVFYLTIAYLSDMARRRAFFMTPLALVTALGYSLLLGVDMNNTAVLYFATFVTATGIYCVVGLNVTWNSNSNAGYYKRATAIGLQQTVGNSAGIMAGQIYRITNVDGRYVIGHSVSLTTIILAAVGYAAMFVLLKSMNKKRDRLTQDEKMRMIDAGVKGDRHPDFRYTL